MADEMFWGTCTGCGKQTRLTARHYEYSDGREAWIQHIEPHNRHCSQWSAPFSGRVPNFQREVYGPLDTKTARTARRRKASQEIPHTDEELQAEFERLENQMTRLVKRMERVRAEIRRRAGL